MLYKFEQGNYVLLLGRRSKTFRSFHEHIHHQCIETARLTFSFERLKNHLATAGFSAHTEGGSCTGVRAKEGGLGVVWRCDVSFT